MSSRCDSGPLQASSSLLPPTFTSSQQREEEQQPDSNRARQRPEISRRLYISHFLSTWNSRSFEFAATLFLATIFPGTLLQVSLYAIFRSAAAILLSSAIGLYIDHGGRLNVVRTSIVAQRFATAISCAILILLTFDTPPVAHLRVTLFVILCLLACVEKVASILNLVSVERDWVVVVSEGDELLLRSMNAQMRRIDLICKLAGPTTIAMIDGWLGSRVAMVLTLSANVLSTPIEYATIAWVYASIPALAVKSGKDAEWEEDRDPGDAPGRSGSQATIRSSQEEHSEPGSEPPESTALLSGSPHASSHLASGIVWTAFFQLRQQVKTYVSSPAFLPSLSLSLLYLNVLSFNGQMVTYLLDAGFASWGVGLLRLVSISFELLATWAGPLVAGRIGAVRAGIWFVNWELICLALATAYFFPRNGVDMKGQGMEDAITGRAALIINSGGWPEGEHDWSVTWFLKEALPFFTSSSSSWWGAVEGIRSRGRMTAERLAYTVDEAAAPDGASMFQWSTAPALRRSVPATIGSTMISSLNSVAEVHLPVSGSSSATAILGKSETTTRLVRDVSGAAFVPGESLSSSGISSSKEAEKWPIRAANSVMPSMPALALVLGSILSRLGLWGFDLSAQTLVQAGVAREQRGSFSSTEAALQNVFEMASFASTAVWRRPAEFGYPVVLSVCAVAASAVVYASYVRRARGHLLHLSCGVCKRRHDSHDGGGARGDTAGDRNARLDADEEQCGLPSTTAQGDGNVPDHEEGREVER